jgi:trk system potassium uptake protein TrkA
MKKQIVIIGLGRFGASLSANLSKMGNDVLAIDIDPQKVQSASGQATHVIQADATNEAMLKELGVGNFDIAIVAIGNSIQNSVLATIMLKKVGVPYVIARASTGPHGEILDKIGADKVVYPESQMGENVAHSAVLGFVSDYMPVTSGYGIAKVDAGRSFIGQTLSDIGFGSKGKLGIATLLIQRGGEVIVTPSQNEVVKPKDILIVSGNDDKLSDFLYITKKDENGKE